MSVVGAELASLIIDAARNDAGLAADLAAVLRPHLQPEQSVAVGWMSSRDAANYLGLSLPALYRLTAAREVPFAQDKPRGKCSFNRDDLDAWRRGDGGHSNHRGGA
ncbi:MAG: helix-turn-helix domain-containing protein [Solirubrobacteraceae bacterium]